MNNGTQNGKTAMTDNDQAQRTRALIGRMAPDSASSIADDQRLVQDLGFESIRLIELTVALEKVFDLPRHDPHQLMDVQTVADVVAMVARESRQAGSADG